MAIILITGAGSGLGLAFLKHFSKDTSFRIFAIDRSWPDPPPGLYLSDRVHRHTVDITSESGLQSLVQSLRHQCHSWTAPEPPRIDLVIHSAGIRGLVADAPVEKSSDVAEAETLGIMTTATLMKTFEVNVVGTFLLMKHLLPLLMPEPSTTSSKSTSKTVSKVVIMGSRMGSISSNTSGGAYAYRASKAALNAVVKSFSIDMPGVCFVVAHPGRVATKLCDGVREDNAMEADEVLPGLLQLIDSWTLKDSGRFVDRFGKDIDW